jgi:type I restriction enzyme, S subunit
MSSKKPHRTEQRLEEVVEEIIDYRGKTPPKSDDGIPLLTAKCVKEGRIKKDRLEYVTSRTYKEWMTRGFPEEGDVALTSEAPLGEVAQLDHGRYALAQRLFVLRGKPGVLDNTYLKFLLQTREMQHALEARASGTTVKGIRQSALREVPIPLPPFTEQRRIADILGTLDDKIDLNRKINRTLEAMARAVFKSWFVDFDPVRAKMADEEPAGIDADTAALFPDRLVDSELGEIPEGWEVKPIKDVIKVTPRYKLSKGDVAPYLEMSNAPEEGHYPHGWRDREFNGSGSKFSTGDTLMAKITPCLENGKTAFVDFLPDDDTIAWGSTEYLVLRSKPPFPLEYSYYLARSRRLRRKAIKSMSGTSGRQRVSVRGFKKFKIVVPPADLAQRFGELARDFMAKIRANHEESRTLAEMRDVLLPRLLSGRLT